MKISHVELVKQKLGADAIAALQALFCATAGSPPSIPVARFRADHQAWLDVLDDIEHRHSFVERTTDGKRYLIRSYALPLIGDAHPLLELMQAIFARLKELYLQHLTEPQSISVLVDGIKGSGAQLLDALYYLTESHSVWSGKTIGFPYRENSTLCISEGVLKYANVGELLSQFYEWHYVNPSRAVSNWLDDLKSQKASVFFPQETNGGVPEWYDQLDDNKKALIREVDLALQSKLSVLPTIGLRTLLDMVMVEKLGDIGGFDAKLKKFELDGYVTRKQAESISFVLDAGNASAHRAYAPNEEDLVVCVAVVKHLMEGVFILQPKMENVKRNTPPRPPRKKK